MTDLLERTSKALADGIIIGDGHTIFYPHHYAPYFTEDELRKARLIRTLESDFSNPKSTIFDANGNPVDKMEGVYNLSFLYWLCDALGVDSYNDYNGRGSQAQELVRRIRAQILASRPTTEGV
jgi:hypothetical protein